MSKNVDAAFEEVKRLQQERNAKSATKKGGAKALTEAFKNSDKNTKQSFTDVVDTDLYDRAGTDKYAGYNTSIAVNDEDADMDDGDDGVRLVGQYTATDAMKNEFARGGAEEDDILESREKQAQIASRETDYQKRRFDRGAQAAAEEGKSYREIMQERELQKEEERVKKAIAEKGVNGDSNGDGVHHVATLKEGDSKENAQPQERKRKKRWDVGSEEKPATDAMEVDKVDGADKTTEPEKPKKRSRWDMAAPVETPSTEVAKPKKKSRWDQAPAVPLPGQTPMVTNGLTTPLHPSMSFGNNYARGYGSLTDEDLDRILPSVGYKVLDPPPGYEPLPIIRRALPAPTMGGFVMGGSENAHLLGRDLPTEIPGVGQLQFFKKEDEQYFKELLTEVNEQKMTVEELKTRKIQRLLLKVKNGTPPMRKTALRQITDNARQFGPDAIFRQLLPLLMEKTLEDQERHLLVKVIDRVLYKLDELVRPHTHMILAVTEPLLIDQDYYARVEGREIISNLAKAVGLAHMISTMRPDIDSTDEYVRNTTARAFAVVASALGVQALLPFLRAVCRSKKSWMARHTGVKIVHQIPILMGCAILPHLKGLVECIGECLNDENVKVRQNASNAVAALAEAANPFGIESFDDILNPLWTGARKARGKTLAGFLKAVGYIIPLMDEEYASYYTKQIMEILIREFASPDEETKKIILKVISQICSTPGVTGAYLKESMLKHFFGAFWVRRMALDRRNYRQVVDTTVDIANKVGAAVVLDKIVDHMKDESEAYRTMTMETIEKIIAALGCADVDLHLEERLVDGMIVAFQEQSTENPIVLNSFGTIVNGLGVRTKQYLPQMVTVILYRLENKAPTVRQQAADLIARIAFVIKQCDEDVMLSKLGHVLFENLGEEYPEVLGSMLGALRAVVAVVGMVHMNPPIKDLLPRLTPILRNRHEKVQENTIDLVGRIADRGPENVNAREWMRICFELLDMLKAHKKGIRRAANNTFGYIAKALGPSDVLVTLLNNLRVQERQSRVCTAVAIGIVAETCSPFTVLPALMNEYRVPELNVQNGVLKALSFMFEYIGEMAKDYVYAVVPLLEDALIDRDQVHRQTAASVVKHIALGVVGLGCEDAMIHLLNLLWPNLFETSPHVIDRVIEAVEAIRVATGMGVVMNYTWAGLFHPARRVRTPYWRIYNDAYVHNADAMVPYYPTFKDDPMLARPDLFITL